MKAKNEHLYNSTRNGKSKIQILQNSCLPAGRQNKSQIPNSKAPFWIWDFEFILNFEF